MKNQDFTDFFDKALAILLISWYNKVKSDGMNFPSQFHNLKGKRLWTRN